MRWMRRKCGAAIPSLRQQLAYREPNPLVGCDNAGRPPLYGYRVATRVVSLVHVSICTCVHSVARSSRIADGRHMNQHRCDSNVDGKRKKLACERACILACVHACMLEHVRVDSLWGSSLRLVGSRSQRLRCFPITIPELCRWSSIPSRCSSSSSTSSANDSPTMAWEVRNLRTYLRLTHIGTSYHVWGYTFNLVCSFVHWWAAILPIYLSLILGYSEDNASVIYHLFTMLCYFTPVFGAILADTYAGKFRWIL